ncbi:MAG: hypothetical protein JWN44_1448, partial [Myxococcales bacterium]|nr:hypothetical protein [Myxococcales bacterium]
MADKDREPGVELDFSDGELQEMGVELAGRDSSVPQPRRSRSMLRVPVDEVPRPQPSTDLRAATTTEPSLPALREDPVDEVVEHAFANGGIAEAVVPSEVRLAATPARDELDAFTAKLIADRDRVIEMEMDDAEDPDTDPKALAEERERAAAAEAAAAAVFGAIPDPVDDAPTRAQEITRPPKPSPPRGVSPALAALARAVAVPNEKAPPPVAGNDWLAPAQVSGAPGPATADQVWSSSPPPDAIRVAAVAAAIQPALEIEAESEGDDEDDQAMELDDGELEDVEMAPPPKLSERQRTLTPVVPPPPMPAPHAGNGHAPEAAAELSANGAMHAAAPSMPQSAPPMPQAAPPMP